MSVDRARVIVFLRIPQCYRHFVVAHKENRRIDLRHDGVILMRLKRKGFYIFALLCRKGWIHHFDLTEKHENQKAWKCTPVHGRLSCAPIYSVLAQWTSRCRAEPLICLRPCRVRTRPSTVPVMREGKCIKLVVSRPLHGDERNYGLEEHGTKYGLLTHRITISYIYELSSCLFEISEVSFLAPLHMLECSF